MFCFETNDGFLFLSSPDNKICEINLKMVDKAAKDKIAAIFLSEDVLKIGYNIKKEIFNLQNFNIDLKGEIFDILIAIYLLSPGKRQYPQLDLSEFFEIYKNLRQQIKNNGLEFVFNKIEMPLIKVLAKMEKRGISLDVKFLDKIKNKVKIDLEKLKKEIYEIAGQEFNLNSTKQLKTILFDKLKLNEKLRLRRTKTGISTAASELVKMRDLHPIINLIIEYRELFKLYSTYIEALPRLINPETKKIHTTFNQTITATGRLSSSEPNLQNIPLRGDLGREIRKAFIADKGYAIVSADYSQIELRIAAHLANDEEMIEAFNCRKDFHTHTAKEIFGVPEAKVTAEMRRMAKAVNFGVLYGIGARSLAESIGKTIEEAKSFIEQYFAVYQGIYKYLEETKALAHSLGYVETLFGRRRYLPEINSSIEQVRAMAERMAINHPIQGTAADLIKMAMIEIDKEIERRGWDDFVKMLLQVHDELVFEVSQKFIEKAVKMIKEKMENVYKLRVPLEAEIKIGKNWGELTP